MIENLLAALAVCILDRDPQTEVRVAGAKAGDIFGITLVRGQHLRHLGFTAQELEESQERVLAMMQCRVEAAMSCGGKDETNE